MARKSPPLRGWICGSGALAVVKTDIDNVVTQVQGGQLILGTDVDYPELGGENKSKFLIRRIIIDCVFRWQPAVLDLAGFGMCSTAVFTLDADKEEDVELLHVNTEQFLNETGRFLGYERHVVPSSVAATDFTAFSSPALPGATGFKHVRLDHQKLNMNLREETNLYLGLSQDTTMLPWIDGDIMTMFYEYRVLLQKGWNR